MSVTTTSRRLTAGAIALVLPFAAVAGCGAEKKRTVKAEFQSAQDNLSKSKAASFTIHLSDDKDALKKLMTTGEDKVSATTAEALLGGSFSFTVNAAPGKTLGDPATGDTAAQLKSSNAEISINGAKGPLAQIRLVAGVVYAKVSFAEVTALAEGEGSSDLEAQLDEFSGGDPKVSALIGDVKAGKWIKLDLNPFVDDFKALAETFTGMGAAPGTPSPTATLDPKKAQQNLFAALKPYVTVKDANDNSKDRVLDVSVDVRPALKAVLNVLKTTEGLPFGSATTFGSLDPDEIANKVKEGKATGTITLADGHLKQVGIDIESIRLLAPEPGTTSVVGSRLVLDIDDSADQVSAPTDVSSVDVNAIVQGFLDTITGALDGSMEDMLQG